MYTSLARLWGYTSLAAIVIIGTASLNISFAGGDPSIKDKKVYQTKSNIKQHDHSSIYKNQSKKIATQLLNDTPIDIACNR